jgi:phage nucleotide-binding protein
MPRARKTGRKTSKSSAIDKFAKGIVPVADAQPYAKVLIYGRNGKRKTRTGAASGLRTLIIDVNEEGTRSVASFPNCDVRTIKTWEEFVWAYWYLKEADHDYEVVLIDTLTQVQKLCMKRVLNEAEDRDPNRPPNNPERRQWGQMTETLRPYIYDFRNLPMHVVFVCQERLDKGSDDDEDSEIRARYVPDLSPGLRGDAMSAVGIMGRMFVRPVRSGKGKREKVKWEARMLVGDHDDYETKDRTNELGYIVRNPTMKKLIEAWASGPPEEEEE